MSQGKVIINDEGKYLIYSEVSCHSPNKCYGYSWTTILNEASVCRSSNELSKLNWKSGSPLNKAVSEIDAEVVRTVKLIRSK